MRRGPVLLLVATAMPAVVLACNALTGVGDLGTSDEPCLGCEIPVRDGAIVEGAIPPQPGDDASTDASDARTDTFMLPSYCTGIVFYARFDNTLLSARGQAPDQPPAIMYDTGKYGQAALVYGKNPIYYVQGGDAGFSYPTSAEGTVAMWFKANWTWPSTVDRTVWKTTPDRVTASSTSSPDMRHVASASFFGSTNTYPDGGVAMVGSAASALTPDWKNGTFNHLAETWSQKAPTITFTLNGGLTNPASTRRETNVPWSPEFANVGFLRLSSPAFQSDAAYDDLALWNHALSLAELQAVYGANKALGDVCGL